jgi:glycosyltransferase involved in cell wall biosynthesis
MKSEFDGRQQLAPKILFYCVLDRQGGVETHVKSLAAFLASQGALVTIAAKWVKASERDEAFFKNAGVRLVHPRAAVWLQSLGFLPNFLRSISINLLAELFFRLKLKSDQFDLVSINASGHFGLRFKRCCKRNGGRLTYHEHLALSKPIEADSDYVRMLSRMDFVSVNSRRDAAAARAALGDSHRILILPALAAPSAHTEQSMKVVGEPFRVAFIGNIAATEKGAAKLLRVWRANQTEAMALTFYGPNPGALGPAESLPANVKAVGPYQPTELSRVFSEIDLLVHPADDESLGLVLVEAMAHGVPFVGTHVGGIIDIAEDNPHVVTVENCEKEIWRGIERLKNRLQSGHFDRAGLLKTYQDRWSQRALGQKWARAYMDSGEAAGPSHF